jgi:hypothetical protein
VCRDPKHPHPQIGQFRAGQALIGDGKYSTHSSQPQS